MSSSGRRLTAWIASCAILLAALAPALAQAFARDADPVTPWGEICTATGMQPGTAGTPGNDSPSTHGTKHCPWCAGSSHACGLPSGDYAAPVDPGAGMSPIQPRHRPVLPARQHGLTQPRAPPPHS